ncbi:hypothetical protein, partial [Prevotella sp.]|uniref:hypothetical protein n=1 Tax=Prevotella sp. TaxID=59823 RepID=UPI00307B2565
PQIAQRSTDTGIYKICEYLWNPWENQISSSRGNLPQIAQRSTDTGIYKICENLWNQWENKSQAAEGISHRSQKLTDAYKNQ